MSKPEEGNLESGDGDKNPNGPFIKDLLKPTFKITEEGFETSGSPGENTPSSDMSEHRRSDSAGESNSDLGVLGEKISSLDTKLDQTERRLSDNIESSERRLGLRIDGVEGDVENVDDRVGNLKWYIMASVALATLLLALMNYGVI